MKAIFEQFGKQAIIALIVLALVFFLFPGFTIAVAIGVLIGIVVGNYFPAIESRAEKFIEAKLRKG